MRFNQAAILARHWLWGAALTLPAFGWCASSSIDPVTATAATGASRAPDVLNLHVPSPDWRDQILYFVMLDRFNDGDSRNNNQQADEFDPGNGAKYSGGDLIGVTRKLDYIKGLGATTVWITPPVANQWWDGSRQYGGYHGYWAENFKVVDAHNGSLEDYRQLSHTLHSAGMYLVQDVVVNHMGNFFGYDGAWSATHPVQHFTLNPKSIPMPAPSQAPFSLNDARNPEHRAAAIYHWTPEIADFTDHNQETRFQLADLDDLNTETPAVRTALRDSYNYWIREVGVDAFRVDTAFHVPAEFFEDFLYANDTQNPGVVRAAAQTGRAQFHVFGEGFGVAPAYDDAQAKKIDSYLRGPDGTPRLPGMINFPLYGSITNVFARGRPTAELGHRIRSTVQIHQHPHLMPSFVDNHDVDRFLAGGSEAGLKQALLLIMTLPGIPTLYYGTEQGFREQRASMFATGYGANGRDHFDTTAPLYRFIQRATALRRNHRFFSRGTPTILAENAAAAGAFAYRMNHEKDSALIVFNTAQHETLLDNLETGLAAGTVLESVFNIDDSATDTAPKEIAVDAKGRLTLRLPAQSGRVWKALPRTAPTVYTTATLTLAPLTHAEFNDNFSVSGSASGTAQFKLVVDGDLANAQTLTPKHDGRWQARINTDSMINPSHEHRVVAWSESPAAVSISQRFRVTRQWTLLSEMSDPASDDTGPTGRYLYPTEVSWHKARTLDIRNVRVSGSGGALMIEVRLRDLIASWNPPNQFDHLALTLFLQISGKDGGIDAMPLQNGKLPNDMRWHYRLRATGWNNALFTSAGASTDNEGTGANASATLLVDRTSNTVRFLLPASALGNLNTLSGVKLYLNTWDYDGGYKSLLPEPQGHAFGGGDGVNDPLIMDDTAVITLP